MGDTGSMALGGVLAAGAIMMKLEFLLAIAGLVYVIEALSVIIQVTYYKKTKKRIFKMAPIHHHFELCGMSERKVVAMFWAATLVFCLLAILIMNI
ncbi:MAG: phospho-N-acetylmuramoyl-pentapeptide-transferase, partial [Firmicutes bacterium]|nr:phospho-N-acetylmuramoyl-pentapeptide-transferase [Bacillota bacterium]